MNEAKCAQVQLNLLDRPGPIPTLFFFFIINFFLPLQSEDRTLKLVMVTGVLHISILGLDIVGLTSFSFKFVIKVIINGLKYTFSPSTFMILSNMSLNLKKCQMSP